MQGHGVVNVEAFDGESQVVCFPAQEAVTAGTEGANVGFPTDDGGVGDVREDGDDGGGRCVAGAVADNPLIRLRGYDGADCDGAIGDGER